MIVKVAHLADIHIKNDLSTHKEYKIQFDKLYKSLKKENPDRIVVVGDITHDFLSCSYECEMLAVEFLINLTKIAPTIVVEGNHCIRKTDLKRASALKNFVTTIKKSNPNITLTHFEKSGFYEDENVIWVNHSHLEKNINPWIDINHKKDNSKIYIDLFHDPIYGSSNDIGYKFDSKRLRKVSDFKGDIGMFGDIHKHQFLNKNNTIAYSSSLIQQDFGENPDKHGYIIWDIKDKIGELIELQTEYTKINFNIEPNFNYDDITFKHKLMTEKSFIKIKWRDISANINDMNELKIINYFKDKNIHNIEFEKNRIYTEISETELLTENIDINNQQQQQQIFKEYLTLNGYDDEFIDEILKVDDIIDERLEKTSMNNQTNWKIDEFYLDNFKSYEYVNIKWSDMNGLIQLYSEENQQGKTTLLDGICYITHGTTLSTNKLGGAKVEKHGDARYINNKRDLDYCEGAMIINVNNKKYAILRRTERTWNKTKTKLNSAKTTVFYYKDGIIDNEHLLTGERKEDTQKMLDKLIGNFEDFIRLTLINSFNINELIAMDRATFIDSIIKDAGYDIFEKKLDVFKKYKKEINENKIVLNLEDEEKKIDNIKNILNEYKKHYNIVKNELDEIKNNILSYSNERDNEIKKLNNIDENILNIDINKYENDINNLNEQNDDLKKQIDNNNEKKKKLKSEYDEEKYEKMLKDFKDYEDKILHIKMKLSQLDNSKETYNSKLENVNLKINNLIKDEILNIENDINKYENDINELNNQFQKKIEDEKNNLNNEIKNLKFNIKTIEQKTNNLQEKILENNNNIEELENSKICPTCNRPYKKNDKHLEIIKTKKIELNNKNNEFNEKINKFNDEINEINEKIESIQNIIDNLDIGIYTTNIEKMKNENLEKIDNFSNTINSLKLKIKNIKNKEYDNDIIEKMKKLSEFKEKINNEIIKNDNLYKIGKEKEKTLELEKDSLNKKISILKKDKEEVKIYESLSNTNNKINNNILKNELIIEKINNQIKNYNDNLKFIKQNKIINKKIEEYDNIIEKLEKDKENLNDNLTEIISSTTINKNKAKELKEKINKYKEQEKKENILKIYQKCIHRDGIPFYLLMKSRDLINQELSDILSSVNFNIFFDEKMNLKMFMEFAKDVIYNVLQGSGAEKAFSAIALKLALRAININSRPNFLMLDEVTGNLKGKSINNFNQMIDKMKNRIDKIIIIEQNHPIDYDFGFEINKDKNGVSHLKIK